jgi:hypothetical protein
MNDYEYIFRNFRQLSQQSITSVFLSRRIAIAGVTKDNSKSHDIAALRERARELQLQIYSNYFVAYFPIIL